MSVKYAILGLLHYRDMHGYRIKSHIERNFGHMWSINYGQIYPNLKKLEQEGLVTKKMVTQPGGVPDRKLYTITQAGREAFSCWLESPPERAMLLRDPFLLRFVFLGFGRKGRALELIDEQLLLYEKQMERRRENMRRWHDQGTYVRQTAQLGLMFNEMIVDWLKQTKQELLKSDDEEVLADPGALFAE